jgi:hypothetical protein
VFLRTPFEDPISFFSIRSRLESLVFLHFKLTLGRCFLLISFSFSGTEVTTFKTPSGTGERFWDKAESENIQMLSCLDLFKNGRILTLSLAVRNGLHEKCLTVFVSIIFFYCLQIIGFTMSWRLGSGLISVKVHQTRKYFSVIQ